MMLISDDQWDLQEAFLEDPKKAFHVLSSNLLRSDKLAKLIIQALNSQSDLQDAFKSLFLDNLKKDIEVNEALFEISKKERNKYWKDFSHKLIFNKIIACIILSFIVFIASKADVGTIKSLLLAWNGKSS